MKVDRYTVTWTVTALVMVLAIAGCTGLGMAEPQSLEDRIAYSYGVHTAVVKATTNSLELTEISSQDAEIVLDLAKQSRALLDASLLALDTGDLQTAEGRLLLATGVLQQLQDYLRTKGRKS